MKIIKGDATKPVSEGKKVIAHICNDIGKWGRGFVMAVSKKWPHIRDEYIAWYKDGFDLGQVQFVEADKDIWVANMIGQHGIRRNAVVPICYESVKSCLQKVAEFAISREASVHMPKIGCGLAGGSWDKIQPIIQDTMERVDVTIYEF